MMEEELKMVNTPGQDVSATQVQSESLALEATIYEESSSLGVSRSRRTPLEPTIYGTSLLSDGFEGIFEQSIHSEPSQSRTEPSTSVAEWEARSHESIRRLSTGPGGQSGDWLNLLEALAALAHLSRQWTLLGQALARSALTNILKECVQVQGGEMKETEVSKINQFTDPNSDDSLATTLTKILFINTSVHQSYDDRDRDNIATLLRAGRSSVVEIRRRIRQNIAETPKELTDALNGWLASLQLTTLDQKQSIVDLIQALSEATGWKLLRDGKACRLDLGVEVGCEDGRFRLREIRGTRYLSRAKDISDVLPLEFADHQIQEEKEVLFGENSPGRKTKAGQRIQRD